MFDASAMLDHSLNEMALALAITFMVPLMGGIIGMVVTNLASLNSGGKRIKTHCLGKTAIGLAAVFSVLVLNCSNAFSL
jgi:hypothetical protein